MEGLTLYKNAFGYLSDESVKNTDVINLYFDDFSAINSSKDLAVLRMGVVEYALTQFTPFNGLINFINTQFNEAELTELQRRFLLDTIKFIETGKRDISILSWFDLIKSSEELDIKSVSRITPLKVGHEDNLLGMWLSHDGGFLDMLWSLRIIFGSVKEN